MMKTFKSENFRYPGGIFEKNAIFKWKKPQIESDLEKKIQKGQIFNVFVQFLSIFWYTCWLRKLKMFNKEGIRCSRGFFQEINAICFKKMPQIQTGKNPKNSRKFQIQTENENSKKFRFSKFPCKFCLFFKWLGSLKTFNKEKSRCPGAFVSKWTQFTNEKGLTLAEIPDYTHFSSFCAAFAKFSRYDGSERWKHSKMNELAVLSNRVVWEMNAVLWENCHNDPKNVKIFFSIFDFPTQLYENFKRFHGLELRTRSTTIEGVV